ncbi:hypothetical protein ADUPG1_005675, partial [Aduncisulcus paluster]
MYNLSQLLAVTHKTEQEDEHVDKVKVQGQRTED